MTINGCIHGMKIISFYIVQFLCIFVYIPHMFRCLRWYSLWYLFFKNFKWFFQWTFHLYFHFNFIPDCDMHAQKSTFSPTTNHNVPKYSLKKIIKIFVTTFGSMWDILLSSTYHTIVHCFPSIILFTTHLPYGFILKLNPLIFNTYRIYHKRADYMQP